MRDQSLDGFGEVGPSPAGGAAATAFLHRRAQAVDGVSAGRRSAAGAAAAFPGIIRAPWWRGQSFQIGVENGFCAWLDCRSRKPRISEPGQTEQRRRKTKCPWPAERRGEALFQGIEQRAGVAADLQAPRSPWPTEPTVSIKPQKGAEQGRGNTSKPRHVAGRCRGPHRGGWRLKSSKCRMVLLGKSSSVRCGPSEPPEDRRHPAASKGRDGRSTARTGVGNAEIV